VHVGGRSVPAKLEYESPTRSFKDRGAAVLVAAALDVGATHLVADSSGNAGLAIATYAAHAGLACDVFVSSRTSVARVGRISETGASVHAVKGTREDVASAAVALVESSGAFYASHVWNPWFLEGTKRYVYELQDQFPGVPSTLVLPVGNGTLVLGAWRALRELDVTARIVAVQASNCAPIAAAFERGAAHVEAVIDEGTIAAGIAIAAPVRGDEVLDAVRASRGVIVRVTDDELLAAAEELGAQGHDIEPTAAAPAAALAHLDHDIGLDLDDVVIPIASGRGGT
jgi:threonine synthase